MRTLPDRMRWPCPPRRWLTGGVLWALLAVLQPIPLAAEEIDVDLELVLAVDTSGSVDDREYALQISGIANAFRDPEVLDAIAAGPLGRIAVTVSFWAESELPKQSLAWQVIADPAGAAAFAEQLEAMPRAAPIGGTGIGKGVIYSVQIMQDNGLNGTRRVVDVSGDGRETPFRYFSVPPEQARAYAAARGVTVNGLAILAEQPDLERYYRESVIVGPGAFALAADDFEAFAEAMRRKLIREITYRPSVSRLPSEQRREKFSGLNENAVQAGVGNGPDGVRYGAGWRLATTVGNIGPIREAHYVARRIPPQRKSRTADPPVPARGLGGRVAGGAARGRRGRRSRRDRPNAG